MLALNNKTNIQNKYINNYNSSNGGGSDLIMKTAVLLFAVK